MTAERNSHLWQPKFSWKTRTLVKCQLQNKKHAKHTCYSLLTTPQSIWQPNHCYSKSATPNSDVCVKRDSLWITTTLPGFWFFKKTCLFAGCNLAVVVVSKTWQWRWVACVTLTDMSLLTTTTAKSQPANNQSFLEIQRTFQSHCYFNSDTPNTHATHLRRHVIAHDNHCQVATRKQTNFSWKTKNLPKTLLLKESHV
jgi:hypothetical protein